MEVAVGGRQGVLLLAAAAAVDFPWVVATAGA